MSNKFIGKPTSREIEYSIVRNLYDSGKDKRFLIEVNNFLKKYPNDESAHFMRGTVYKKHDRFNEAISDFKLANRRNNNMFAVEELFFMYYYLRMYKEALKLIPILRKSNYITSKSIKIMTLIIKKELGILSLQDKFSISDYSEYQVLDYRKEDAINHIKEHKLNDLNDNSKFRYNINLNYLFELIENNIKIAKRSKEKNQMDIYYFGISNVGTTRSGDNANYVRVVAVPNTYNIISIYPVKKVLCEAINIEYDYDKLFKKENTKVKRISQIEKFNKRYKKSTD